MYIAFFSVTKRKAIAKLKAIKAFDGFTGKLTSEEVDEVYEGLGHLSNDSFLENVQKIKAFWTKKYFDDQFQKPVLETTDINNMQFDTTMVK